MKNYYTATRADSKFNVGLCTSTYHLPTIRLQTFTVEWIRFSSKVRQLTELVWRFRSIFSFCIRTGRLKSIVRVLEPILSSLIFSKNWNFSAAWVILKTNKLLKFYIWNTRRYLLYFSYIRILFLLRTIPREHLSL